MSTDAALTLAIVLVSVGLQAFERASAAAVLLGTSIVLLLAGVLTPGEAFAGFSNAAPITVAALYIIARAVQRSGLLAELTDQVMGNGVGERPRLARLCGTVGAISAFTNNTTLVAVMAPEIAAWSRRSALPASRYLMPMSYAVILGGVATTIGTSTNLVVSGMLEASGRPPLGLFEMTPVGLPVAIAGIALLVILAPRLLPERRAAVQDLEERPREFVLAMKVRGGGALDGRTIEQASLRRLQGVFLFRIERGSTTIAAEPSVTLLSSDVLYFAGNFDRILDLQSHPGLVSAEAKHFQDTLAGAVLIEAVVGLSSPLVGRTLRAANFRSRYQAAVLAIHREGDRINERLGDVTIRHGDTLLLIADTGFTARWRERRDFLVLAQVGGPPPVRAPHAWRALLIAACVIVPPALGLASILTTAVAGALACVVTGVLRSSDAVDAIDVEVYVLIAASLSVGLAIEKSGLAAIVAGHLVSLSGLLGPWGPMLGLVLATSLLTELVTNTAAAAIMFPIAVAAAASANLDPRAAAIAVTIIASASFLTPIGYQTNLMVYGLGGYRFLDYFRLGWPLTVAAMAITVFLSL